MGHDDLLSDDLFASELNDDAMIGSDILEEDDALGLDDELAEDDALGLNDEEDLDDEDVDYSGGYNPDEWN